MYTIFWILIKIFSFIFIKIFQSKFVCADYYWKNKNNWYERWWIFFIYKRQYVSIWNNIYDYSWYFLPWLEVVEYNILNIKIIFINWKAHNIKWSIFNYIENNYNYLFIKNKIFN